MGQVMPFDPYRLQGVPLSECLTGTVMCHGPHQVAEDGRELWSVFGVLAVPPDGGFGLKELYQIPVFGFDRTRIRLATDEAAERLDLRGFTAGTLLKTADIWRY